VSWLLERRFFFAELEMAPSPRRPQPLTVTRLTLAQVYKIGDTVKIFTANPVLFWHARLIEQRAGKTWRVRLLPARGNFIEYPLLPCNTPCSRNIYEIPLAPVIFVEYPSLPLKIPPAPV
jgi:hypothetical protein